MAKVFKAGDIVQWQVTEGQTGGPKGNPDGFVVVNEDVDKAHAKSWGKISKDQVRIIGLNNGASYSPLKEVLVHCDRIKGIPQVPKAEAAKAVNKVTAPKPSPKFKVIEGYKGDATPNPTYDWNSALRHAECCLSKGPVWECERPKGHPGPHIAWCGLSVPDSNKGVWEDVLPESKLPTRAKDSEEMCHNDLSNAYFHWSCEREKGHSGPHMAWAIAPNPETGAGGKLYEGGVWDNKGEK